MPHEIESFPDCKSDLKSNLVVGCSSITHSRVIRSRGNPVRSSEYDLVIEDHRSRQPHGVQPTGRQFMRHCQCHHDQLQNEKVAICSCGGDIAHAPLLPYPRLDWPCTQPSSRRKKLTWPIQKLPEQATTAQPYTDAKMLVKVLNELGIGNWVCEWYPTSQVAHKITQFVGTRNGAPVITHMAWNNGGYHFIVCDTIVRTRGKVYGDFCDPGDGTARTFPLVEGQNVNYDKNGSIAGALTGWVVYRTGA